MGKIPSQILDTFPATIFLQTTGEYDLEPFDEKLTKETTWCVDKIYDSDVEYLRSDIASKALSDANKEIERLKGLIEKLYKGSMKFAAGLWDDTDIATGWGLFKQENNL